MVSGPFVCSVNSSMVSSMLNKQESYHKIVSQIKTLVQCVSPHPLSSLQGKQSFMSLDETPTGPIACLVISSHSERVTLSHKWLQLRS